MFPHRILRHGFSWRYPGDCRPIVSCATVSWDSVVASSATASLSDRLLLMPGEESRPRPSPSAPRAAPQHGCGGGESGRVRGGRRARSTHRCASHPPRVSRVFVESSLVCVVGGSPSVPRLLPSSPPPRLVGGLRENGPASSWPRCAEPGPALIRTNNRVRVIVRPNQPRRTLLRFVLPGLPCRPLLRLTLHINR